MLIGICELKVQYAFVVVEGEPTVDKVIEELHVLVAEGNLKTTPDGEIDDKGITILKVTSNLLEECEI